LRDQIALWLLSPGGRGATHFLTALHSDRRVNDHPRLGAGAVTPVRFLFQTVDYFRSIRTDRIACVYRRCPKSFG